MRITALNYNMPLKVLALVPDYIEKPSGGVGEQFRQVKKQLKNEVEYFICGFPEQNNDPNFRPTSSPIPHFPHQALTTIFGQSEYFWQSLQFSETFDLIHAFDWSTFYAGVLASRHFKKPLICTVQLSLAQLNKSGIYYCHQYDTVDGRYVNDLQIEFERYGLKNANRIIQVSEYYKNFYNEPEFNEKTTVIYNGINSEEWVQKRKPNLPGKNKLKLCYIGRASVMKGLPTILDCNIPDDVDFYFIVSDKNAEEPYYSAVKQKANNKNIFHINGLYGQDKIDFLFSMDGVVMPSVHEPFGIVALEALISKNVLITTATGGIAEIVDGIPHLPIKNSKDLESQINFLKNSSKELYDDAISKGVERALQFEWSRQAKLLLDVYKNVI